MLTSTGFRSAIKKWLIEEKATADEAQQLHTALTAGITGGGRWAALKGIEDYLASSEVAAVT